MLLRTLVVSVVLSHLVIRPIWHYAHTHLNTNTSVSCLSSIHFQYFNSSFIPVIFAILSFIKSEHYFPIAYLVLTFLLSLCFWFCCPVLLCLPSNLTFACFFVVVFWGGFFVFVFCHINFKKDINRQAGEGMTVSSCYDISDTGMHLFFTRYATLNVTINGLKTIHWYIKIVIFGKLLRYTRNKTLQDLLL